MQRIEHRIHKHEWKQASRGHVALDVGHGPVAMAQSAVSGHRADKSGRVDLGGKSGV
jgi:hypothetical protein